ncbi:MAG: thermonuclease family protein [Nitrospirota bacterium]|nr:thermonuclease family protein [Nitrospirota bacterium]
MRSLTDLSRRLALPLFIVLAFASLAAADQKVRVVEVIDGDTAVIEDGRKVRYLGINTPERGEPLYQKAKDLNRALVLGRKVRLEFEGDRESDAYGRLLAYVYVGDQMVNARLVREGVAHALFIGPEGKHDSLLLKNQAEARQRGIGIWAGSGRTRILKITSVHLADPAAPERRGSSHVRIVNLSEKTAQLAGHTLSDDKGHRYIFPDVSIEPGYSVIVSGRSREDTRDGRGQAVVYWSEQDSAWKQEGGVSRLADRTGTIIDTFPYQGNHRNAVPADTQKEGQGKIIGNKSSRVYHLPGQANYEHVKEKNRVYFDTEEEAIRAGYRRAKR